MKLLVRILLTIVFTPVCVLIVVLVCCVMWPFFVVMNYFSSDDYNAIDMLRDLIVTSMYPLITIWGLDT